MNQSIRIVALFATLFFGQCSELAAQTASDAVYDAAVESAPNDCPIVVADHTEIEGIDSKTSIAYAESLNLDASVGRAFAAANMTPQSIVWSPREKVVRLVTKPERLDKTSPDMLLKIRGEHPCVAYLYSFSAVGLSPSATEAMVKVNRHCNALCGAGSDILYLRLLDGKWKIVRWRPLWIN